jgi:hypothetical protein
MGAARPSRYGARPFPAYAYVPGTATPHPTRDPAGHSYEPSPTPRRLRSWRPEDWRDLDEWLHGVDLFNAGYFWEAHEAWEGLWAAQPRDSVPAVLLQGLIQIAAALLKARIGSVAGARALSSDGLDKLRHVAAAHPTFMGLDVARTTAALEALFAAAELPASEDVPSLELDTEAHSGGG